MAEAGPGHPGLRHYGEQPLAEGFSASRVARLFGGEVGGSGIGATVEVSRGWTGSGGRRVGPEAEGGFDLLAAGQGQEKIGNLFGTDVLGRAGLLIDDQGVSAVVGEAAAALMPLAGSELNPQPRRGASVSDAQSQAYFVELKSKASGRDQSRM